MKFLRGIKLEESHCLIFKIVISLPLFLYYNIILAILVHFNLFSPNKYVCALFILPAHSITYMCRLLIPGFT